MSRESVVSSMTADFTAGPFLTVSPQCAAVYECGRTADVQRLARNCRDSRTTPEEVSNKSPVPFLTWCHFDEVMIKKELI